MLDRRLIVFAISGLLATGLYAVVAGLLVSQVGWHPLLASGCAFATAMSISYFGNTVVGFRHQPSLRNLHRFLIVSALGMTLTLAVTEWGHLRGLGELTTVALAAITIPALSFSLHVFWTFRRAPKPD